MHLFICSIRAIWFCDAFWRIHIDHCKRAFIYNMHCDIKHRRDNWKRCFWQIDLWMKRNLRQNQNSIYCLFTLQLRLNYGDAGIESSISVIVRAQSTCIQTLFVLLTYCLHLIIYIAVIVASIVTVLTSLIQIKLIGIL